MKGTAGYLYRFLLLPPGFRSFRPGTWVLGMGFLWAHSTVSPKMPQVQMDVVWRLPLPQLLFLFTLQLLSDHLRCDHVSKAFKTSPVMFPIHRATAVVLRFALQVALDQKATEVTGSWMPVGEKSKALAAILQPNACNPLTGLLISTKIAQGVARCPSHVSLSTRAGGRGF